MFSLLSRFKLYAALGTIIGLALIVGIHLYHDRGVRIERDRAVSDLNAYKAQQQALTDTKRLENAQKKADADALLKQVDAERRVALEKLGLTLTNRDELTKKVSVINAKLNEASNVIERNRANTATSLQLSAERDSLRMPKSAQVAAGLSTSDSNIADIRDACRLTTLDLLECQGIVEADTAAVGREK